MEIEKKRIASLCKQNKKIIKITPKQFTPTSIIQKYSKKHTILILCHGNAHEPYSFLPPYHKAHLVDLNPVSSPDFLGNMRSNWWIRSFPENYYKLIWLMYLPPPSPFSFQNIELFKNLRKLLRNDGEIRTYYMLKMYNRSRYRGVDIKAKIRFHANLLGLSVRFDGGCCIFRHKGNSMN